MADPSDKMKPADPRDLADALAFALRFQAASASTTPMRSWPRCGEASCRAFGARRLHRHEAAGDQRRRSARAGIRAVTGNPLRPNRVSSGRGTLYSGPGDSLGASGAFRTRCRRKRKPCPATARTHRCCRGRFSRHDHCEGGAIGIRGNAGATNCGSRSAPRRAARRASELIAGSIMRTAARARSRRWPWRIRNVWFCRVKSHA
jgi:hypothetical protein